MGMLNGLYVAHGCRMPRILTHSVARVRFRGELGKRNLLEISQNISIADAEIEMHAIRSQGPGGQNVNKVSSAINLRFDKLNSSSLTDDVKNQLIQHKDRRISAAGILNIKAQRSRSQEKNRVDAIARFKQIFYKALIQRKTRKKTQPSKRTREKRLADKSKRAKIKRLRRNQED